MMPTINSVVYENFDGAERGQIMGLNATFTAVDIHLHQRSVIPHWVAFQLFDLPAGRSSGTDHGDRCFPAVKQSLFIGSSFLSLCRLYRKVAHRNKCSYISKTRLGRNGRQRKAVPNRRKSPVRDCFWCIYHHIKTQKKWQIGSNCSLNRDLSWFPKSNLSQLRWCRAAVPLKV